MMDTSDKSESVETKNSQSVESDEEVEPNLEEDERGGRDTDSEGDPEAENPENYFNNLIKTKPTLYWPYDDNRLEMIKRCIKGRIYKITKWGDKFS